MQEIDDVIEEVTTIVEWYKNLSKDYSNIEDLMYARQKICGNMYMLAVALGKARQYWKECEFETELVRRRTMAELLEDGVAVGKADAYARADSLDSMKEETIAQATYHTLKFMIDSTQEVNNTIMQHISTLKKERESIPQYT
jgi:hypothetical protein